MNATLIPAASLDAVVRTEELRRRRGRAPDYQRQAKAMETLVTALAERPRELLQTLCQVAQEVCGAGSAGISLLSPQDNGATFYWPAITGEWRDQVGGGTPREFGPCGVVLDRNSTQLFIRPERYYPYIQGVTPPIEEVLLAPFYVDGKATGTVWVLSHDPNRQFDAEDQRQLESIAKFAATAYQSLQSLQAVQDRTQHLQSARGELAQQLETMGRLHTLVAQLNATQDQETALAEILRATIQITGAKLGNVQLFDPQRNGLFIVAHQGFEAPFLEHFKIIDAGEGTACGRALRTGKRIVIPDIQADASYAPHAAAAAAAGLRAVQSTPLIAANGEWLGMLSTHYPEPHEFTQYQLHALDLYALEASRVIERNRQQTAVRESLDRLQAVLSASEVATWVWDIQKDRVFADANLARFFGVSPVDAAGGAITGYIQAIHPDDRARVEAAIAATLEGPSDQYEVEYRLITDPARIRWVTARGKLQRDADGKPLRFPGVLIDITERKKAEEAILEGNRRKDEFLAMLAHELRNPLAPIVNGVAILAQAPDSQHVPSLVSMMQRQVSHMVRLIDDLLDVSRVSRGKIQLRQETVELAAFVRQAIEANRPYCEGLRHELTLTLPGKPIFLHGDFTRLTQVMGNLLSNACKFTNRGGRVAVVVERCADEAIIRVRDSGIGISAEQLPRIFDLFAQADTSLERTESGLGIGLTVVKRLVEMHGGTVTASSAGLGKGAEITLRLPALPDVPATAQDATASSNTGSISSRVLIVDDNADSAESLAMLMRLDGHMVKTASDGASTFETLAGGFRPDIILLDIGLPGMNGYDVARTLRADEANASIVLVALTGWGQEEDRARSRDSGFDAHLVKPVDLEALRAAMRRTQLSLL